jgi:addiction module HigA family antidote
MKSKTTSTRKPVDKDRIPSVHPGEILLHEFLEPARISQYRLAQATGIPASRISDLVHGRRGITPDSAIRLGKALGVSTEFWLNLQHGYDVREARYANEAQYAAIPLLTSAVA